MAAMLLSHLHDSASPLPLHTIQGALAHHLANAPPLPTPLAATAISSPFFVSLPFIYPKLDAFLTSFRHATHLKYHTIVGANKITSKWLMGSGEIALANWIGAVLKGLQGGHPVLRLAACGGLLLGMEDVKKPDKGPGITVGNTTRSTVEEEIVVALAEVMDTYSSPLISSSSLQTEWEREFQPAGQDTLSLALVLASQPLPLVEHHRVEALPLQSLARLLANTIGYTFKHGAFLSSLSASVTFSPSKQVHITSPSHLLDTLQSINTSPLTSSISSISKLTAMILCLLLESPRHRRNISENLYIISDILELIHEMSRSIERDWVSSPLANVLDADLDTDSKEPSRQIWTILKMFLFTTIMISESVLSALIYLPPHRKCDITPSTMALQTLHMLSHLSFVISQFGGVSTMTKGFEHLKKTFYLALDILSQSEKEGEAEAYVRQLCLDIQFHKAANLATIPLQAKLSFSLSAIEQLVPVVSDKCIRDWVWGACSPHLNDPTYRDIYESAHSVVLSIFASYAQRHGAQTRVATLELVEDESAKFMHPLVVFYARCLIENTSEGKLTITQLRLAYPALVRAATLLSSSPQRRQEQQEGVLAWYCIRILLDAIQDELGALRAIPTSTNDDNGKEIPKDHRLRRLLFILISTLSALPLELMVLCLDHIRDLILTYPTLSSSPSSSPSSSSSSSSSPSGVEEGKMKRELAESLLAELLEKVGDENKEAAMKWWYDNRELLVRDIGTSEKGDGISFSSRESGSEQMGSRKGVVESRL